MYHGLYTNPMSEHRVFAIVTTISDDRILIISSCFSVLTLEPPPPPSPPPASLSLSLPPTPSNHPHRFWATQNLYSRTSKRILAGEMINAIVNNFDAIINKTTKALPFLHFSAHDTTVMPLLIALEVFDGSLVCLLARPLPVCTRALFLTHSHKQTHTHTHTPPLSTHHHTQTHNKTSTIDFALCTTKLPPTSWVNQAHRHRMRPMW
jgi:hypothetical protein